MQQVDQRTGLILQALVLPQVIAVDIRFAHGSTFVSRRRRVSNRLYSPSVGMRDHKPDLAAAANAVSCVGSSKNSDGCG